ncbi:hypothetical protein Fmac_010882 [Flemingia macrophylla]|uniref:NB-ARC domain-containing protein n=1 Tax=Flemingia macrophylla TaxID=520843 RepID=A0ABD1ML55_9FABA
MKRIVTNFDQLLARKDRYKFAFNDRAAEKSTFPYIIEDNVIITSTIRSIQGKLRNLDKSSEQAVEINSMFHDLEDMNKKLLQAEETAGRNAFGLTNDIRYLVSKLDTSSDSRPNSILSIVGMIGAVGKTTLAKAIYYNKAVVEHFQIPVSG